MERKRLLDEQEIARQQAKTEQLRLEQEQKVEHQLAMEEADRQRQLTIQKTKEEAFRVVAAQQSSHLIASYINTLLSAILKKHSLQPPGSPQVQLSTSEPAKVNLPTASLFVLWD